MTSVAFTEGPGWAVTTQGHSIRVTNHVGVRADSPRGVRGKATFSKASRRRLLHLTATIDWKQYDQVVFITLTYNDSHFPSSQAQCKADLNSFLTLLRRRFPACSGIWRFEINSRGSRKFHPHFHILLGGTHLPSSTELFDLWRRGFVHIRDCSGDACRFASVYVAKYMSKPESKPDASGEVAVGSPEAAGTDANLNTTHISNASDGVHSGWSSDAVPPDSFGRAWGVIRRALLPYFEQFFMFVSDSIAQSIRRLVRSAHFRRHHRRIFTYTGSGSFSYLALCVWCHTFDELGRLINTLDNI